MPTLDHKFIVKSIVELPKLKSVARPVPIPRSAF